jgi:hypothetical protein
VSAAVFNRFLAAGTQDRLKAPLAYKFGQQFQIGVVIINDKQLHRHRLIL